jgi:ribosomal protein L37E
MTEQLVICGRCGQAIKHSLQLCEHCGYAQLDRLAGQFQRSLGFGALCFGVGLALLFVAVARPGAVSWLFLGLSLAYGTFGGYWIFQARCWLVRRKTAATVNLSAAADARTVTPVSREAVDMFDGTVGLGEAVRLLQAFFEKTGFTVEEEPVTNGMLFSGGKEFGEEGRPGLARYEIKVIVRSVRLSPVSVQAEIRETYVPIWDGYYVRYRHYYNAWLNVLRGILTPVNLPPEIRDNRLGWRDRVLEPAWKKYLRENAQAYNTRMAVLARAHERELVRCRLCGGQFMAGTRDCCYCGQPIPEGGRRRFMFTNYFDA